MSVPARRAVLDRCIDRLVADGCRREEIRTLFVPGRVELLGKHTDYCGGRSVTCAIDRGFHLAYAPEASTQIRMAALDLNQQRTFDFTPDVAPAAGSWANYPMSVARRLARNFEGANCGAHIAFASTLPQAAGMSSSSALVVATFLVLDAINGFARRAKRDGNIRDAFQLAEYLGTLENGQSYGSLGGDAGVGTFGGSEDHTAITLGRAGRFGVYGYAPTRLEREVALPTGHVLAIASSGVVAEKTGAARDKYNAAALLVGELVRLWNAHEPLRQPTLAAIVRSGPAANEQLRSIVRDRVADPVRAVALLRRLDHFLAESEAIIPAAMDALAEGDLAEFGGEVGRSQALAQTLLRNQVPETQYLARAAMDLGAAAASSFGAGFGGSVWALVERDGVATFIEGWRAMYASTFADAAIRSAFFTTVPADGTAVTLGTRVED